MQPYRFVLVALLAALASACASTPPSSHPPAAEQIVAAPATEQAPKQMPEQMPTETAQVAATDFIANDAPTEAEDDFAAIYGTDTALPSQTALSPSYDPWEKYNRRMHAFNNAVDRSIARPLARGYVKVVPRPVRTGVSNFFDNLQSPLSMFNLLLQGHPKETWDMLGRFLMNTTLGIGGVFDPASKAHLGRHKADFGQTLAVWGWRRSRYFELPLFGPRTLRDSFGLLGDVPLSPSHYISNNKVRYGTQGLQLVDMRAQLLSLDAIRADATDDYALVRDAWVQRRNYQIQQRVKAQPANPGDEPLPDYLREEEPDNTPDVPANAMPIPSVIPIPGVGG
jgi:phospholipid-binding lipoprotein MlaA